MFATLVLLHGAWRWVVIAAGTAAVALAVRGLFYELPWASRCGRAGWLFGVTVDVQVIMGALLYFIFSPLTTIAASESAVSQGASDVRYFAVIHPVIMTLAWIAVHLAAVVIKRGRSDLARHRRAIWLYASTLALVLGGIPWSRPLLRL